MEKLEDVIEKVEQLIEVVNKQSVAIKKLNKERQDHKHTIELLRQRIAGIKMKLDEKDNLSDLGNLFGKL